MPADYESAQPSTEVIPNTDDPSPDFEGNAAGGEAGEESGQSQTTQQDNFDPKTWSMTYKGQTVMPKDRQHLINLAQQGWGYSQSMADLKRQRAEIEASKGKYSKYDALDQALTSNPQLAESIWGIVQKHNGTGSDNQPGQGLPPEVMTKLQEFDQFKQTYQQQQADQTLQSELKELRGKYTDEPWDVNTGEGTLEQRVIQHALDKNILDLHVAYKDLMWDNMQSKVKATTLNKAKEAKLKAAKQGIVDGGSPDSGSAAKDQTYKSGDTYHSLTEKILQKY